MTSAQPGPEQTRPEQTGPEQTGPEQTGPEQTGPEQTGPEQTGPRHGSGLPPLLGVVIVTFNAADVILDCLESLLAAPDVRLAIVVVDNASTDDTLAVLRAWASGAVPYAAPGDIPFALTPVPKPVILYPADRSPPAFSPPDPSPPAFSPPAFGSPDGLQAAAQDMVQEGAVAQGAPQEAGGQEGGEEGGHRVTLLETGVNGGFAAGVNAGLALLARRAEIDRFWVLNPDSVTPPATPCAFARHPGGFALLGGRVNFLDTPGRIQIDGGLINRRTGVTGNINLGAPSDSPPPDPARLDFITGASMVASRAFCEAAGPMAEDYFLYYEEVDWALRRGTLPLGYCPGAVVYHRAGTAIGSATLTRMASPFSIYFKHRGRMRFMRRFYPAALPMAWAFSFAKAAQIALKGYPAEALTLLLAAFDRAPPAHVRARLAPEAARRAFAPPAPGSGAPPAPGSGAPPGSGSGAGAGAPPAAGSGAGPGARAG